MKMITNTLYGKNEAVDVLVVAHVQQILNDEPGLINNRYNEVVLVLGSCCGGVGLTGVLFGSNHSLFVFCSCRSLVCLPVFVLLF